MPDEQSEINDRFLNIIGGGAAVMNVVVFTVIGAIGLENITYGAIVGLFAGVGTYLFVPWILRLSAVQNEVSEDLGPAEAVRKTDGDTRMAVFGLGLELGGIAMLAFGLSRSEPDPVSGLIVAVAIAIVVPLVASVLLNR